MRRRVISVAVAAVVALAMAACSTKQPEQPQDTSPIVIGSTLPLTGAFAATGKIHQLAGQIFIDRLNAAGGLLGRQVQWKLYDDQSNTQNVTQLYDQLINQDHVDLLMGPYATPNILAAMAVAERYGYVLPQHTAVLAPQLTYSCQFPAWSIGTSPNQYIPNQLFDAVATLPTPPKNIAVVTSQNGSAAFVADGLGDDKTGVATVAQQRGLTVVLNKEYDPAAPDFPGLAQQVAAAKPDLLINNSLGVDTVNLLKAMQAIGYTPPLTFSLFPAPGPLVADGVPSNGLLSVSIFEGTASMISGAGPDAQSIVDEFETKAKAASLYDFFETQAAASYNAWEILTDGVKEAGSLDNTKICDALHSQGADTTFSGHLTFDPSKHNFWDTTEVIKQIQNGAWQVVWPTSKASATIAGPAL